MTRLLKPRSGPQARVDSSRCHHRRLDPTLVNQAFVWLNGRVRSAEQQQLRETVRLLLDRSSDTRAAMASPDGFDRTLWTRLCTEIGVAGLSIPEEYGGLGASLVETGVVLGELG